MREASRLAKIGACFVALTGVLSLLACSLPDGDSTGKAKSALVLKALPSHVAGFTVTVSGPGMVDTEVTVATGTDSVVFEVPAGSDRTFEVTASTASAGFSGSSTTDLAPGEEKTLVIEMSLASTKIVVPDYLKGRIVQMDDMNGGGWKSTDLGLGAEFAPRDVDFDRFGRIYIANGPSRGGDYGVLRIDDINDTSPDVIVQSSRVYTIAVDRQRELLYYINDFGELYRTELDGQSPYYYHNFDFDWAFGMDVDADGILYIGYMLWGEVGQIDSYNPAGSGSTEDSYSIDYPHGVIVKEPYVYVAQTGEVQQIVQFTKTLEATGIEYGDPPGGFYGPSRFVARLNDSFYVIDENGDMDRLVKFDSITGGGWQTYAGKPGDEFGFFELGPR